VTPDPASTGAAQLLRSVGLLVDGPGQWGRPVAAPGPGVFAIELVAPLPAAPIELTRVGKWIEHVQTLRLDGARPTSRALAARLAAFWLPSQTVLYIGSSDASVGRRVAAMARTDLGDRRPFAGGHWLRTLRGLEGARIWWAPTDATEEYADALLEAFAEGVPAAERSALPDRDVVLPFANLRRPDSQRKATGVTGALLAEPVDAPAPPTRVVQLPDGDAEGARGEPPEPRRRATASKAPTRVPVGTTAATPDVPAAAAETPAVSAPPRGGALTAEGAERLQAELDQLILVRRPEVIARIRTAKEHGDLKENAEYHAAREEQSFLEGRVQALEARLRSAVIVDAPAGGARVGFGSRVTVEADGETVTYTIVGASDSDPAAGRISSASPVGRALVGRDVGDSVVVRTPAGERHYRIVEVG
jgi:transcription elongation factor GreA